MKNFILSVALLIIFIIPAFSQSVKDTAAKKPPAPLAKDTVHRKAIVIIKRGKDSVLYNQIEKLAKPVKGIVGVSILNNETGDTLSYNGKARLVLHSVMKFPIALTVLHWVDTGKLTMDQLVHVTKHEWEKNTNSPLRDQFPGGGDFPISKLVSYMVSYSDNSACDLLLKQLDGPQAVQKYMLQLGIRGIAVRTSEADMASAWELQYANWCKPVEMTQLLNMFYNDKILSKASTDTLYKIMTQTTTGANRLKGLLPAGTVIAHKTGTSPTSAEGLSPATNDVGIITLPNGKHLVISVFVCNSTNDEATREGVIAKIGKAAFDYYSR
jgi:beta-lactamase class A